MSIKRRLTAGLVTYALIAASATAALADSVTYTVTIPNQSTNWSGTIAVPMFNGQLGTVTSIDFALAGDLLGTIHLVNSSDSSQTVTATLNPGLFVAPPVGGGGGGGPGMSSLFPVSFTTTIPSGGSLDQPVSSNPGPTTVHDTNPGDFGPFIGTGPGQSFSDPASCTPGVNVTGSTSVAGSSSLTCGGTLTETFNFTPTPEPASLALIGLGLAAVGARRARRKAKG